MKLSNDITVIDETALPQFRRERLSPSAIMSSLTRFVHVLLQLGIGVGKSHAVDRLIASPEAHAFFDLIIYAAPTRNIINERELVRLGSAAPITWTRIEPRPRALCGSLDSEWTRLEAQGCAAHAKDTLCRRCPNLDASCSWPTQYQRIGGRIVVFCTEQQFVLNPRFYMTLIALTGAARPLLILDEAKLVGERFEWSISRDQFVRFRNAVIQASDLNLVPRRVASNAIAFIDALLAARSDSLKDIAFRGSFGINGRAAAIQRFGLDNDSESFHYLGHDLDLFAASDPRERRIDDHGSIHFIARPYLNRHVLIAAAHLDEHHVARRLGLGHIESPFRGVRFAHSQSRIVNLRCRLGAKAYFPGNSAQILGTIAVMLLRNIAENRTTLLVATKDSKALIADELAAILLRWGIKVRFVVDGGEPLPATPDPQVIPIIHYGVLGTNCYEDYQAAYCVNSYYVSQHTLMRAIDSIEPDARRISLKIVAGPNFLRQAILDQRDDDHRAVEAIANDHLRHLEIDPVIQAVGRVRFATKPREVLFFAMHDFHRFVAGLTEVRTLAELRDVFGVPAPVEVRAFADGCRIASWVESGLTVAQAAARCEISERTAFRRLKACETAKNPIEVFLKGIWQSRRPSGPSRGRAR